MSLNCVLSPFTPQDWVRGKRSVPGMLHFLSRSGRFVFAFGSSVYMLIAFLLSLMLFSAKHLKPQYIILYYEKILRP